jgi:hypothetical protein
MICTFLHIDDPLLPSVRKGDDAKDSSFLPPSKATKDPPPSPPILCLPPPLLGGTRLGDDGVRSFLTAWPPIAGSSKATKAAVGKGGPRPFLLDLLLGDVLPGLSAPDCGPPVVFDSSGWGSDAASRRADDRWWWGMGAGIDADPPSDARSDDLVLAGDMWWMDAAIDTASDTYSDTAADAFVDMAIDDALLDFVVDDGVVLDSGKPIASLPSAPGKMAVPTVRRVASVSA